MFERLVYEVELVKITASSERDAFRLFETLNDRGLALSAADLIKNKLLSRCGDEIDDAVDAWGNVLASTKEDDIVSFLRTYWIAFKGFVCKRKLYDAFKEHIDSLDSTESTLLALELDEQSKAYEQIAAPNANKCSWGPDIAHALERLNGYRARSCRPAILACSRFHPSRIEQLVHLCECITVRYSLVGEKNPNFLEELYTKICKRLREVPSDENPVALIKSLPEMSEVPDDNEFVEKLCSMEITNVTTWRVILCQLNAALGSGELRVDRATRVHVEHILPQKPRATCLTEANVTPDQALALVNQLGNLTLLAGRRNRELSNKPFSAKRKLYADSEITLTREIANDEKWGSEEITQRSRNLATQAKTIFPHPSQHGALG